MSAIQNRRVSLGRHPLLKIGSLAQRVFNYLKVVQPGATIQQIASALREENQSVNGCLQRMKKEGLAISGPSQKGNRVVTGYFAVTENESGHARDKVMIRSIISVNEFGEYSVQSKIVGQSPLALEGKVTPLLTVEHWTAVPKPTEPYKTREIFAGDFSSPVASGESKKPVVIEGEILDIKEK